MHDLACMALFIYFYIYVLLTYANIHSNLWYKMHVTRCWGTDHYRRSLLKTSTKSLQGNKDLDLHRLPAVCFKSLGWLSYGFATTVLWNDRMNDSLWHCCILLLFISDISDAVPQVSKTSSSTLEADQSIDEILGLQVRLFSKKLLLLFCLLLCAYSLCVLLL